MAVCLPAKAAVFDFSFDEFPDLPASPTPAQRIGSLVDRILLDGVEFSVNAQLQNGTPRFPMLYVPGVDTLDPDLVPTGRDFLPNLISGTLDPNPIWPGFASDPLGFSANSLAVQDPNFSQPNDLAANTVLTWVLTSDLPVRLTRLTFVDDVDAIVRFDNTIIGDVVIDGAGSGGGNVNCPANGDNCVAGLVFSDVVIQPGESFSVSFDGSGAVIGFEAIEIPLPAGLPLMLTGLAALGWLGWRKRAA
jgi:hypothetical protein